MVLSFIRNQKIYVGESCESPSRAESFTWSSLLDSREHNHKTNPLGDPPFLILLLTAQLILKVCAKDPLLHTVQLVLIMFMCCDYRSKASPVLPVKHYIVLYKFSPYEKEGEDLLLTFDLLKIQISNKYR